MSKSYQDLRDLLKDVEKEFKEEVGFKVKNAKNEIVSISYAKFVEDVKALGEYLLHLNLDNKRIAFISPNRYEWEVTYMAVATSNLIAVPLDRSLPESEFRALLLRSEAEVLLYDKKYEEMVEKVKNDSSFSIRYYFNMDTELFKIEEEGKKLYKEENNRYDKITIEAEAMRFMLYTSGTTQAAKCVMLSHHNLCSNVSAIQDTLSVTKEDTFLSFLPLHHTFECTTGFLYAISVGAKIAYCEGIRHFVDNLKEYEVTVFVNVPAMIEGIYKNIWKTISKNKMERKVKTALCLSRVLLRMGIDIRNKLFKDVQDALGGKIRFIVSGAAALNPTVAKNLNDMGIIVYQGYGLTETSPVVSTEKAGAMRHGSVGKPMPGITVKVREPGEDGIGEILVKAPSVMLGYYGNEEATKEVLQEEWFATGDLGRVDEDGYLFITGRKKDVIVLKNGKNVFPDEVEALINELAGVTESIVYGKTEADGDINLNAKIVYNKEDVQELLKNSTEAAITEEAVREYYWNKIKKDVNKKMPTYKYIKNIMVTTEPLIKTTTNKVKRHEEIKKILSI